MEIIGSGLFCCIQPVSLLYRREEQVKSFGPIIMPDTGKLDLLLREKKRCEKPGNAKSS